MMFVSIRSARVVAVAVVDLGQPASFEDGKLVRERQVTGHKVLLTIRDPEGKDYEVELPAEVRGE